uniref:Uncharacterized protein n=1 Tax=Rhodnius prolixus TaxID=13249 RepID=T1IB50_RHOPR
MENNEDEDFAGNYFKPKRATELLIRAQQDVARANSYMYGSKGFNFQGSLNAINNWTSVKGSQQQNFLNNSWSGASTNINGWLVRKPVRLESLPVVDKKPLHKPQQLNTLDVI